MDKEVLECWEKEVDIIVKKNDIPLPPINVSQSMSMEESIENRIEILATNEALSSDKVVENLVNKKATELNTTADVKVAVADAKLSQAEAIKFNADATKAEAFYNANEQILNFIGIKKALGYKTMKIIFPIALTLFLIVAILIFFPFSVVEHIVNFFIDIIGSISGRIATKGLKVLFGVLTTALTGGLLLGIYFIIINTLM